MRLPPEVRRSSVTTTGNEKEEEEIPHCLPFPFALAGKFHTCMLTRYRVSILERARRRCMATPTIAKSPCLLLLELKGCKWVPQCDGPMKKRHTELRKRVERDFRLETKRNLAVLHY